MTLEEQEDIIQELEAEVLRGKGVLENLRQSCAQVAAEDRENYGKMDVVTGEGKGEKNG